MRVCVEFWMLAFGVSASFATHAHHTLNDRDKFVIYIKQVG